MLRIIKNIPIGLTLLRLILGPLALILTFFGIGSFWYILILTTGFLSDLFDGIIARKLNIATVNLRTLDSWADTVFYTCIFVVSIVLYRHKVHDFIFPIAVLLTLELVRHVYDHIKFKKSASYHMWSAKLWGIFLYLGFVELLGFGETGLLFSLAIYIGIITDVEGLLASFILKKWQSDVPSLYHAFKLNKTKVI